MATLQNFLAFQVRQTQIRAAAGKLHSLKGVETEALLRRANVERDSSGKPGFHK